ncbi:MAG: hypothetical protein AVDCRST_MAG93-5717, partial [uncultured Chloroflexia bacterium]
WTTKSGTTSRRLTKDSLYIWTRRLTTNCQMTRTRPATAKVMRRNPTRTQGRTGATPN